MSTTTFAISVIAAFVLGITLAGILVCLVGQETEESPQARRAALGRAAARARTQSPPVQSTEVVDRGTTRVGRRGAQTEQELAARVAQSGGAHGWGASPFAATTSRWSGARTAARKPMADRAYERIAAELLELGVDARPIDGWVYIALAGNRGVLCISAEYGASLAAERYPLTPSWFAAAPTDREHRG